RYFRQLRQPEGQVDVRARVVDAPVAAVAVRCRTKDDAAEEKRAVVVVGGHHLHVPVKSAAAEATTSLCGRDTGRQRSDDEGGENAARRFHRPSLHGGGSRETSNPSNSVIRRSLLLGALSHAERPLR